MLRDHIARTSGASAIVTALAVSPLILATLPTEIHAQATSQEITITITRVKALDKADELSEGDFFGRATIDGDVQATAVVTGQAEFRPGWKLSKMVTPGKQKVKLELIDKDVAQDDPIDINKFDNKRDLDFVVDTRTCRVEGLAKSYRCGARISRAGKEPKKADITFTVDVKK